MHLPRCSGVLLHPTALPGPHGIGSLGAEARDFVDFLAAAGQHVWQVLPLGPTGFGDSPYTSLSAFAGNPLLIDLPTLVAWGDLEPGDLEDAPPSTAAVDFAAVHCFKEARLKRAAANFLARADQQRRDDFACFCAEQSGWLDDYALFIALRRHFAGRSWQHWPAPLRLRESRELAEWQTRLAVPITVEQYWQYCFFRQWAGLKDYANRRGIRLFGDLPIFVALDAADVWAHQHLFRLDAEGHPTVVAGVPPDYFSATGQLWGNPLYRWEAHAADGFTWWRQRLRAELLRADLVRIDHFRGLESCWAVPVPATTAEHGQWEPSPGMELCRALQTVSPGLPIVAEDLGIITAEVDALRRAFDFPGMKILQFAFDSGADNPYLPHNYERRCVVYTGTHDNATTLGWWHSLTGAQHTRIADYLGKSHPEIPADLIRLAMASVADLCIIPCQDLLGLGDEARFNRPGVAGGNWRWRLLTDQLSAELAESLHNLAATYRRLP